MKCDVPKMFCNVRDENGNCTLNTKCRPVVDQCLENGGCNRIDNGYCKAYINPAAKWRQSKICPLSTNFTVRLDDYPRSKKRVGQQKQKKSKK